MKDDEATDASRWLPGAKWESFNDGGGGSLLRAGGNALVSVRPSWVEPGKFYGLCLPWKTSK